jgi:molybdate transport system substrate-binding protein
MLKTHWAKDWKVDVPVLIERHGHAMIGDAEAEFLSAIAVHGSITKAAKAVGVSYRTGWTLIQEINQAAGEPLVAAAVGGVDGGGAKLTERGAFALKVYDQVRRSLHETAAASLRRAVSPSVDAAHCVHLSAAISLQEVIGEMLAEYALREPTVTVRAIFGASDELADNLLAGAHSDVFVSAEQGEIDRLVDAGMMIGNSQRTIASNTLAVIGIPRRSFRSIDELRSAKFKHLALAHPGCPLGRYSKSYLQSAGLYEALLPKILHVDNSRAVLAAVAARAAEIGLAFASDAAQSTKCVTLFRVPYSQAAARYVAAMVRKENRQQDAQSLLDYMSSAAAARCLRRYGFRAGDR